jgi:metal-responsive CopG/Arc/MetJ family transcriptional regulator
MDETRSERFSVSLTPSIMERLDAYAAQHRWTRSTAAAVLIEEGLRARDQEGEPDRTR